MVEVNGQEEQGKLILRYNQNKSRKTESLDPKDQEDGGNTCMAAKGNMGVCCWGLRKITEDFLHQKLIEQT